MKFLLSLIFTLLIFILPSLSRSETLFYTTPDIGDTLFSNDLLMKIKQHAKAIDIIAPQIYEMDENGIIAGSIDSRLISLAKENHIKIMPLIINAGFDQTTFHHFLHNSRAQEQALLEMLNLCKQNQFYGMQFDFENVNIADKNELTHFVTLAANRLHQHHFILSIAVVPRTSDILNSDYDRWYFENWSGAYDYSALAKNTDFLSVMTYDQHTSLTTPGPIAALDWTQQIIQRLLTDIPPHKISLGIPNYSGYWYTGKIDSSSPSERYKYRSKELQISYAKASSLLTQFSQPLIWQKQWQSSYAIFNQRGHLEYLFVEDRKSFAAKLALINRYHLRGMSIWKFGLEDPTIWPLLSTSPSS